MPPIQTLTDGTIKLLLRRRTWVFFFSLFAILLSLVYVRFTLVAPVNHDEVEHAHAAFKLLTGKIPYRDFYQNHWPAYWLLVTQWIRAFPLSINAILAGRVLNLLMLAAAWWMGLRLLSEFRGGRTWLGLSIYTCTLICAACLTDFHMARPDPLMVLLGTAGLCFYPRNGSITKARALVLGILFGLSISVSTKILPFVIVMPGLAFLYCIRLRSLRPAFTILPYAAGLLMGLGPTLWWILSNGLQQAFCFDVFGLNRALTKPLFLSFYTFRLPGFFAAILGMILLIQAYRRQAKFCSNGPMVLGLALVAAIGLGFLSRHAGKYNLQASIIPMAVAFTGLLQHLLAKTKGHQQQIILCMALTSYPVLEASSTLVSVRTAAGSVPQSQMKAIIDLAKPGNRNCTAFSPRHPIFCRDVSGLSNGWDLTFPITIKDPGQIERFKKIWHEGIRNTVHLRPDIILRDSSDHLWARAEKAGLITQQEINALDALRPDYEVKLIGDCEFWIRRPASHQLSPDSR